MADKNPIIPAKNLTEATKKAQVLAQKTKYDHYVVAKRIMGDYHIVVMNEKHFYPFTSLKPSCKFHDILRVKRVDWSAWKRDANQGGMDKHWPSNTGD
tara:strand:- start:111 stop:404 length:294 start_codon:yes stop_codon:yes gene_type:complete